MKQKNNILFFIFLSLISLFFLACSNKHKISDLTFPSSSIISNENRFALIIDPYIAIRDKPGSDGITVSHGRRGDVLFVRGNQLLTVGKEQQLWINIETGWVQSDKVALFSNKSKALTAAINLN
ncbi:MAG TPA: hypothetical protein VJ861_01560 [Treponemataceae bacterium]|nr:hypothetical protein [Treponemataceae bacterium]